MTEMPQTVCIVGLGLMGGSLALAWRQAGVTWRVVGVDRDTETLDAARAAGAIAQGTDRLAEGLADAGAVVIAIPVRGILRLLPEIGRLARAGTLVMDLGSTKAEICAAMEELPPGIDPVGGHPMCGTERAGFAAAQADLFREHPFVLCPLARTSPGALAKAQHLATASGGRPALADPAEHDAAVAAISHLPYVAAVALVQSIGGDGNALAWRLAAAQARRVGWQAGEVAGAGPITRLF